jgi:menaquinone-9 beta-reductase
MTKTYDLIVIGGGPAGCATAITASRAGWRVLLLERARYPRHRVCGEFVSAESLALLSELLSEEDRELVIRAPNISRSRVFIDNAVLSFAIDPPASSIPRFDFDGALWNSCLQSGIDARQECPVQSVEGHGAFSVSVKGGLFQSRALVNAAGRWSFLSSTVTRSRAASERWVGVKAHFHEARPSPTVDLYFFPGGYCGVQPVVLSQLDSGEGLVNACAMVRADVTTELGEVFELHPALKKRSRSWRPAMDQVSTSPLIFHAPEPLQGSILQAGDAATFVDPFIGDGISLALRSGVLAADCLQPFLHGGCSLSQAGAAYEKQYRDCVAPVFRASSLLRSLLRMPGVLRRPAMSILQYTPAVTRHIVRMTR